MTAETRNGSLDGMMRKLLDVDAGAVHLAWEPRPGSSIEQAAEHALTFSRLSAREIVLLFNDWFTFVGPTTKKEIIVDRYSRHCEACRS